MPTVYYVYQHKRASDGRVFYVGKGKGKRAYQVNKRNNYWNRIVEKHGLVVEIFKANLTEYEAFDLEKKLISYYGRHNLCNMTDGGEGASGVDNRKSKIVYTSEGEIFESFTDAATNIKRIEYLETPISSIYSNIVQCRLREWPAYGRFYSCDSVEHAKELRMKKIISNKQSDKFPIVSDNGEAFRSIGELNKWFMANGMQIVSASMVKKQGGKIKRYGNTFYFKEVEA